MHCGNNAERGTEVNRWKGIVLVWDKLLNAGQRLSPNRLAKVSSWILPLRSDPKNAMAGKSSRAGLTLPGHPGSTRVLPGYYPGLYQELWFLYC